RRDVDKAVARPLRWPSTKKERYDLFDTWHHVAMQYSHKNRLGLHFMAVAKLIMIWRDGSINASNKRIANLAGGCSIDVIKRQLDQLDKLGLITRTGSAHVSPGGRVTRTRIIRLAFPAELDARIRLSDAVRYEDE